jgi:hypothetical protein
MNQGTLGLGHGGQGQAGRLASEEIQKVVF